MKLERFADIVGAYGADAARWPEGERLAALALLAHSPQAQAIAREAQSLDGLLDLIPDAPVPATLLERLEAGFMPAAQPTAQHKTGWRGWLTWLAPPAAAMAMGLLAGVVVPPPLSNAALYTSTVEVASSDDLPSYGLDLGLNTLAVEEAVQ